jgi:hypothetical protein
MGIATLALTLSTIARSQESSLEEYRSGVEDITPFWRQASW